MRKKKKLYAAAKEIRDLVIRWQVLAKGIGPLTVNIFLRELRRLWEKTNPLLADPCVATAPDLGFILP